MKFILSIAVLASMLAGTAAFACNRNGSQVPLSGVRTTAPAASAAPDVGSSKVSH